MAFAVVVAAVAIVRFRVSPLYPTYNSVNSDVYIYKMIGNSWTHGLLPYRDVFDIKGPFLFLLFGLFAWVRPSSMGPPLVVLTLLAFASVWLAYAIAQRVKTDKNVTLTFAEAAGFRPILSVGLLFAARTSYISKTPMSHPFQIDYYLYTDKMGSSEIQARYLRERTFDYVWIHIDKFDKSHDIKSQIEHKTSGVGSARAAQRAALAANYVPVLSCKNHVLMRSNRPGKP